MRLLASIALVGLLAAPVHAAQGADPDWPCVQRRVDHLSLAVMWPHPVAEDAEALPDAYQDVAEAMALRRVSVGEVGRLVDELAATQDLDVNDYGRIFAEAFERIDRQRSRIVRGIVRYARGQAALSQQINALREQMKALQSAEDPDFDRMDEVEAELDWRERVFDDRNSALTYVCESPVLLERRAYEIAQELLRRIE